MKERSRVGWACGVIASLLVSSWLLAVLPHQTLLAQGTGWSKPVLISIDGLWSWFPDLAVDRTGDVHVIYNGGLFPNDDSKLTYLVYTMWNGQTWSKPNDIATAPSGVPIRNSIAADNAGNLHLLYKPDWERTLYKTSPAAMAGSAPSWSQSYRINGAGVNYMSDIAVDSRGIIHAVWDELIPVKTEQGEDLCQWQAEDIFYRRSTDGGQTWSRPINLSNSLTNSARAQVEIDSSDVIHVTWDEGWSAFCREETSLHGVYVSSSDRGESWSALTIFSYPENTNAQTVAASDGRGGVMVVWTATSRDEIYYDWSSDGGASWLAPGAIPGIYARLWGTPFDIYTMKTDSAGNIHLIVVGRLSPADETLGLYHLEWDGSLWSAPTTISAGGFPDYPRLTIGGGNKLHVVWFDRYGSALETSDKLTVWYSSSQTSSPTWTPVPTPEPTATATLTPTPSLSPTSTPFPTVMPGSGLPNGLYTESDEVARLAIAASPVLILVMIIAVVKLGWLRKLLA